MLKLKSKQRSSVQNVAISSFDSIEELKEDVPVVQSISAVDNFSLSNGYEKNETHLQIVIPLIRTNEWRGPLRDDVKNNVNVPQPLNIKIKPNVSKRPLKADESNEDQEEDPKNEFGLILSKGKKRRTYQEQISEICSESVPSDKMTEEEKAIASLMTGTTGEVTVEQNIEAIPIMAVNKIPGIEDLPDETSKYRYDVSLRPDESTLEDYKRIPIESFGKAMLMGMGWTKNDKRCDSYSSSCFGSVSYSSNRFSKAYIAESRPHLAGLGANIKELPDTKKLNDLKSDPDNSENRNKKSSEESRKFYPTGKRRDILDIGVFVNVIEGSQKGKSGDVISIREVDDGVYVKIAVSDKETIKVWKEYLDIVEHPQQSNLKSWLRPHLRV
ncbi:hypothetical protein HK096_004766, partial [Nowakowskiella sp. JEL0078]